MKVALIVTTIRVPRVLERYRLLDKEVAFFVTGDRRTPHVEARSFVENLGNAVYYSDTDQEKLGYRCSEIIGWNKIMRRNIALLEALQWGANIVVSVDDDNIPLARNYFEEFKETLSSSYNGLMVSSEQGWFNVGEFLHPRVYHRGFPHEHRNVDLDVKLAPVSGIKIGVAAGLWLGDPDIDAIDRIAVRPTVTHVSEVLRAGLVVNHGCLTPVNSQNTAYVSELAPLMMVWIGVGRYDDIWASYVAQRVMMETNYHIHFGSPFVWQQRNVQNQWTNLKDELFGMEFTSRFCSDLLAADLGQGSVLVKMRRLYERMRNFRYLPPDIHALGQAWAEDVERVFTR